MSEYISKVHSNGPDQTVIESGGTIDVLAGGKILAAGTQAATIADIANDANGTAIATAVNAVLAALKGAGIIASE
jgi:hypothetical protein